MYDSSYQNIEEFEMGSECRITFSKISLPKALGVISKKRQNAIGIFVFFDHFYGFGRSQTSPRIFITWHISICYNTADGTKNFVDG